MANKILLLGLFFPRPKQGHSHGSWMAPNPEESKVICLFSRDLNFTPDKFNTVSDNDAVKQSTWTVRIAICLKRCKQLWMNEQSLVIWKVYSRFSRKSLACFLFKFALHAISNSQEHNITDLIYSRRKIPRSIITILCKSATKSNSFGEVISKKKSSTVEHIRYSFYN